MWSRLLVSLALVLIGAPSASALQPIYVDQLGATPDGVVRTDCAITSGSAVLTCTGGQFVAQDVGKVIAVYDVGPLTSGYRQPLATTIASRQSATQVTLATTASATANPSSRVVYGTDNTAILQQIIDAHLAAPTGRGGNVGGALQFGPGLYLVTSLSLPCSAVGDFTGQGGGNCVRAYNNIALHGSGRMATTLENWDPTTTTSVVNVGAGANAPDGDASNPPVRGFALTDATIRQVGNATNANAKTVDANNLADARFERLTVTGSPYECLYVGGQQLLIRDNYGSGCGAGGPGTGQTTAAFVVTACVDCLFVDNVFDRTLGGANYAAEMIFRRSVVQGNHFTCDPTVSGQGVQFGSGVRGLYDVTITANTFRNCGIGFTNANGVINRVYLTHNAFLNSHIEISSGIDTNVVESVVYPDTIGHGTSVIDGNQFVVDGSLSAITQLYGAAISIGQSDLGYAAQESYVITHNTLATRQTYCTGGAGGVCTVDADCTGQCVIPMGFLELREHAGGVRWAPSTACTATPAASVSYVFPVVYNGYYYRCTTAGTTGTTEPAWNPTVGSTTADGSAVWTNAGRKPTVVVADNVMVGPNHLALDWGPAIAGEVIFRTTADRDAVSLSNLTATYPWVLVANTGALNLPIGSVTVPPGFAYGDLRQAGSVLPTVGYYPKNAEVVNTTPSSGHRGWVATRAGRAGAIWTTAQAYAFGDWIVPTVDNGHVYTQRTPAGCTSDGSAEPSWNTGAGTVTTDNDCSWKESGAAVLWLEF